MKFPHAFSTQKVVGGLIDGVEHASPVYRLQEKKRGSYLKRVLVLLLFENNHLL